MLSSTPLRRNSPHRARAKPHPVIVASKSKKEKNSKGGKEEEKNRKQMPREKAGVCKNALNIGGIQKLQALLKTTSQALKLQRLPPVSLSYVQHERAVVGCPRVPHTQPCSGPRWGWGVSVPSNAGTLSFLSSSLLVAEGGTLLVLVLSHDLGLLRLLQRPLLKVSTLLALSGVPGIRGHRSSSAHVLRPARHGRAYQFCRVHQRATPPWIPYG
ncbi:hypothetical protein NDU88_000472 [Pleurodeles waltl]|uniref:Uncharacterized protein n=1 Tax=Pleurodeles waltl TaxID=8319 RepID=A0AAV7LVL3_PLEWA|nr:hypothetical protein NDU88_000472 [Pleurodeles waltl]